MPKNIFVFGLNDANRAQMAHIPGAEEYVFHSLLTPAMVVEAEAYEFGWLLEQARGQLDAFEGTVDGLVTFWDFPSTELRAVLCQELGLPGPSVEAMVRCSHKHVSRLEQQKVIPDFIPAFEAVNPFDDDPLSKVSLEYPFFLKPVKSYASFLSFHVSGPDDFRAALPLIRENISRYGAGGVDATWCIAEEHRWRKDVHGGGLRPRRRGDDLRPHRLPPFPGADDLLPLPVPLDPPGPRARRIDDLTRRVILTSATTTPRSISSSSTISASTSSGCWRSTRGSPSPTAIFSTRWTARPTRRSSWISPSDASRTAPSDGGSVQGRGEVLPAGVSGRHREPRPSGEIIQELEEEFEGAKIQPHVATGQRLSELQDQEPYSYRLGVMYLGGVTARAARDLTAAVRRRWLSGSARCPRGPPIDRRKRGPARRGPRRVTKFPNEIEAWSTSGSPCATAAGSRPGSGIPKNADEQPVPAILEYIPYRKRDHTRYDDETAYTYLAGHGYACVRVDMRGSGESEGVLKDEYIRTEQIDGLDVLKWIGEQPWCDGGVGMVGISWGGFNALQIAALQPPELKAIITVCSTDDRYGDDVHYMGGALLADNLSWASSMFSRNAQPPDPEIVGDRWKDLWLERLEGSGLWVAEWMRHPWRDEYWKHGSVCEDFSSIQCPVLAVGGWADGYTNAIFRLLEGLSEVPRKGIIGPWSHIYPHFGKPGPAIGFLQESRRWWDHWLKGIDSGVTSDPDLTVWMQDYAPPRISADHRPGRWLSVGSWPSESIREHAFWLDEDGGLSPGGGPRPPERTLKVQSPLSVGLFGGKWSFYAVAPELPHDQREEDGGAVVFESEPLKNKLPILGAPVVELELSSNRPVAMVAVRLSDVAPDDKATRVTFGLLNLTHRDSHENPEPLEPGQRYTIRLPLKNIAQVVPKGHRLRIAISSSYWPIVWPSPEPTRLTIYTGASRLLVPELPRKAESVSARSFQEPVIGPAGRFVQVVKPERTWLIQRNMMDETTSVIVSNNEGTTRIEDIDLEVSSNVEERYSYQYDDYESLRGEARAEMVFERPGWKAETATKTVLTSTKRRFRIRATLDAYLNGSRVYSKSWDEVIVRKLV